MDPIQLHENYNLQKSRREKEISPRRSRQEEMTPKKNKKFLSKKQETPRTVFFLLGGEDVISLSYALEYFVIFHIIVLVSVRSSRPRPHQDNTLWLIKVNCLSEIT